MKLKLMTVVACVSLNFLLVGCGRNSGTGSAIASEARPTPTHPTPSSNETGVPEHWVVVQMGSETGNEWRLWEQASLNRICQVLQVIGTASTTTSAALSAADISEASCGMTPASTSVLMVQLLSPGYIASSQPKATIVSEGTSGVVDVSIDSTDVHATFTNGSTASAAVVHGSFVVFSSGGPAEVSRLTVLKRDQIIATCQVTTADGPLLCSEA
jgi:hypothetical protein